MWNEGTAEVYRPLLSDSLFPFSPYDATSSASKVWRVVSGFDCDVFWSFLCQMNHRLEFDCIFFYFFNSCYGIDFDHSFSLKFTWRSLIWLLSPNIISLRISLLNLVLYNWVVWRFWSLISMRRVSRSSFRYWSWLQRLALFSNLFLRLY